MKLFFIAFIIALAIKAHATTPVKETEVGIAVASGNTRSESYNIKQLAGVISKTDRLFTSALVAKF